MHRSPSSQPVPWTAATAALLATGAFVLVLLSPYVAVADSPHIASHRDTPRCAACHAPHTAQSPALLVRFSPDATGVAVCLTCHDGSDPSAADVVSGTIDAFALTSGHTLTGGSLGGAHVEACDTCHDTHAAVEDGRMLPARSVNGVVVGSAGRGLCSACHDAANSWFGPGYPATSEPVRDAAGYPVSGTWPGPATYESADNAHRRIPESTATVGPGAAQPREQGDCRYCHASHRGPNAYDSLLSTFTVPTDATLAADRSVGAYADLCFTCHGGDVPPGFETAPVDIERFATSGSASAGHSIVTSGGALPVGSPLPCFECHNPHGSSRGNASLISDELGGSLTTSTGVRAFCFTCHTTADTAAGWDGSGYAPVPAAERVVGIARTAGALHLSARDGHAETDSASCYACHGNSYTDGGRNVHDPATGAAEPAGALAATAATDTVPPVTTAELGHAPSGAVSLVATDTGSGVDLTYFTIDGGSLSVGTEVLTAIEGTHTVQYWSVDLARNTETTNTATFTVDRTAPVTTTDAIASYAGTATVSFVALDGDGGSGVAVTWYRLDGGRETTGSLVATATPGDHTIEFWSVDKSGNMEAVRTRTFTVIGEGESVSLKPFSATPLVVDPEGAPTSAGVPELASRRPTAGSDLLRAPPPASGAGTIAHRPPLGPAGDSGIVREVITVLT